MPEDLPTPTELTLLLRSANRGDEDAAARALTLIWDDLKAIAHRELAKEKTPSIEPTAIVDECFVRLIGDGRSQFENRLHFFRTAASCIRRLLIDRARSAQRQKRGAESQKLTLDSRDLVPEHQPEEFLALDIALEKLKSLDERKHEVVMLRFFAGLNVAEAAQCLDVSPATVKSDWAFARAWLQTELESA